MPARSSALIGFLFAIALGCTSPAAVSQAVPKVPRVGVLYMGMEDNSLGFERGMREAAPFMKQFRDNGGKATFVAGDGVKDDAFVKGAGEKEAEGAILTCPCVPPEKLQGTFAADYKAATGRDPGTYSAEAFDAANILLSGIKAGNTTRDKLNTYVNNYTGKGITTTFKFQSDGDLDPSAVAVWAYKVQGGKIVADQLAPKP